MIKRFCKNIEKFKDYIFFEKNIRWFTSKIKINLYWDDEKTFNKFDVVRVNLWYNIWSELNKERFWVVVSPDFSNWKFSKTVIILPIKNFDKDKKYPNKSAFIILKKEDYSFLHKDCLIDFLQIRTVSKKRILNLEWKIKDVEFLEKRIKKLFL